MKGILVGCDAAQEWLLPWWHKNLRKHNRDIPIAFGDLGMSKKALAWCKKRGILIPSSQIPSLEAVDSPWLYVGKRWTTDPPPCQCAWFRKPLLMQQSPFQKTVWLDLDCEVLGDLSSFFSFGLNNTKFALTNISNCFKMISEDKQDSMEIKLVNSGVILFEKGSPLLDSWVDLTRRAYPNFYSDDCILAFLIATDSLQPARLPCKYNWLFLWGHNPEALLIHWEGIAAKTILKRQIEDKATVSYRQFPLLAIEERFLRNQNFHTTCKNGSPSL